MQFLQNHIAFYGASLKAQKSNASPVKMPNILLLVHCLVYPIIWTINTIFENLAYHFLLYLAKYPLAKNLKNSLSRSCEKCVKVGQTNRPMDKRTGLILYNPSTKM